MDLSRVAVLDDYNGSAGRSAQWNLLGDSARVEFFHDHLTDADSLVRRLRPFDIVVIERERTPFTRLLFQSLPRLRMLVATGPVNWSVDLDAAADQGVVVTCTEARQDLTSELTIGLILALARRIVWEDRAVREGHWQEGVGTSLKGKTLGLIGLGQVGQRVAQLAMAFGMSVQAWSQNLTDEAAQACQVTRVTKEQLLSTSDFVSLHVVLSERTRGMIDRHALSLMKKSAFLINTSRGPLVREEDLIDALSEGAIAGAALDVFDTEPLPAAHAYRALENIIVTPHIGYITDDQYRLFYGQVVENILAFLADSPIRLLRKP